MNTLNLGDVVKLKTISEILLNGNCELVCNDGKKEDVLYTAKYQMSVIDHDEFVHYDNKEECVICEITTKKKYINDKIEEFSYYTVKTKNGNYLIDVLAEMFEI